MLCLALRAGSTECAVLILEQEGVDVNHQSCRRVSALEVAVSTGQPDVTRRLLQLGAQTDVLDVRGQTLVHSAVQSGHTECLKLLLESLAVSGVVAGFCFNR